MLNPSVFQWYNIVDQLSVDNVVGKLYDLYRQLYLSVNPSACQSIGELKHFKLSPPNQNFFPKIFAA